MQPLEGFPWEAAFSLVLVLSPYADLSVLGMSFSLRCSDDEFLITLKASTKV